MIVENNWDDWDDWDDELFFGMLSLIGKKKCLLRFVDLVLRPGRLVT